MKTDELAATTMPNTIGTAKLATVAPPQIAIGNIARNAVADVNTERAAAQQEVIERLRATSTSTITTGSTTVGSYTVTWAVTDSSTSYGRTIRIITTGPGLSKAATVSPVLTNNVADTFNFVKLKL